MKKIFLFVTIAGIFISCKTTTYFIVRHAEKEVNTMTTDVALSEAGKQRAEALKETLKHKRIGTVYSTNYIRTKSTAQPLATEVGVTVQAYDLNDSTFIHRIKNTGNRDKEGNFLIVGHSNTVDNIVNELIGEAVVPGDLKDTDYGDLFIVKQRGKKFTYQRKRFGN